MQEREETALCPLSTSASGPEEGLTEVMVAEAVMWCSWRGKRFRHSVIWPE
jgi:hypothetical protein